MWRPRIPGRSVAIGVSGAHASLSQERENAASLSLSLSLSPRHAPTRLSHASRLQYTPNISLPPLSLFLSLSLSLSLSRGSLRPRRRWRRILIAIPYDRRLREHNRSHLNSCHYIPRDGAKGISG